MRRAKSDFETAGGRVVLVGMGTVAASAAFAERFDVGFPLVSDPERRLYQAFEIGRLKPLGFFSPKMALRGAAAMARGHGIGRPTGDVRQLPGVFVIDTAGRIVFSHYAADPADHPSVDRLLAALADARRQPAALP